MSTGTPITQTDQEKNERIAVLLGWERVPGRTVGRCWLQPGASKHVELPDFLNDWARFPDLQAYVRGLSDRKRLEIGAQFLTPHSNPRFVKQYVMEEITPRILADAILAVEEGQPSTSS